MKGKLGLVFAWAIAVISLSSCLPKVGGISTVNQFIQDTAAVSSYVKTTGIPSIKLSQGIWLEFDQVGKGARANFTDTVTLTYKTILLSNNTVVDDKSSTPVSINFSNLIEGVRTALPLFPAGSKGRIFIPSYYGYGSNANGNVPANSNLIVEFSLLGVTDYHLKNDTVTINKYIAANKLKAFSDPSGSGIRYSIDSLGSSATVPQLTDSITTKYTVKFFDGTVIQTQNTPTKYLLSDLILAWKVILPVITEGTVITFYVPSSYAYGPNSSSSGIPANTNLIFHVNLVKVSHN